MNGLVPTWKALPLWAKIALLPFVVSGVVTAITMAAFAVGSAISVVISVGSTISNSWRRTTKTINGTVTGAA